ncbi:uncharacterized protein LOC122333474 [Puntigrus tetrazona]|uniref:uncharacterized protein LOC122333474 n=1 Tax=Puntigrus tetrazona TaxID=1606681 RepID=UPI001C8ACACA|nr:uncharacterized protein LOC122333474 [Puntigrus tetrazona]
MRFLISLCVSLLLLINASRSDPCSDYTSLDQYWRNIRQISYGYYQNDDSLVDWSGWYRLYLNGESAQMSEWCVNYVTCGGETGLYLNDSHPTLEDGVVTRELLQSNSLWWRDDWGSPFAQCGEYTSLSIQVKACPGDYYVYELIQPNISSPGPSYCAVSFSSISSDPCYNYESLDRPWRANNESEGWICDEYFSWSGWYRLFYYGMNIQMSETCLSSYSCNAYYNLWLNGPHPEIEDGVVIREVCGGTYWGECCSYKTIPIRVKACPGNYYVYELVNPQFWCSGYCTDVSTISWPISTISPDIITGFNITLDYDPCDNYNILDNYWRSTFNYWSMYGFISDHDDTRVEWDGWYRLFIDASNAQIPDWCMSYMSCGGFSSLYLAGSHPLLEDGVVTREIYGSHYDKCSYYTSEPIEVKACPGDYYVYRLTRPTLSIPVPVYCAVPFFTPSVDPCYNYTSLDEPWRSTDNPYYNNYYYSMCDYNVEWNGWYRMFYNGENTQMPDSCVHQYMCGTYYPLWLKDPHPQLEDGVVTREVCVSSWGGCCAYTSHPIRVKACPGDYYVYEFVKPAFCGDYCVEPTSQSITSASPITASPITASPNPLPQSITPPAIGPFFDPCYNYNVLDDSWRSTNNQFSSQVMCDAWVSWNGWYRFYIQGQSVQMPDTCVEEFSCGTYAPLWLNGGHPTVEDGVVTRDVCGHWSNDCCFFQSNPIKVKACPGDYYVYELVSPSTCYLAYCADALNINNNYTTTGTTTTTETTTTVHRNSCSELSCSEEEKCGMKDGVYGCFCGKDHHRRQQHVSFDFTESCESSSGSMSVSRCQLFEAGFPADILHLNDPSCRGTVRNGSVEFHFDNDEHICGTSLVANGTHFIYSNFILGTPRSEGLISRQKILKLPFSCVYPQTQSLSMNVEINPLESIVHETFPGEGRYQVRMTPYEDDEFTRPFTGRVDAELDQKMNVEVRVEGVDSRQFALVMDTCWATPVNDPDYSLRWDLIVRECPNPNDDTVELLQNGVSTSSRFSFKMFIFTANSAKLYLHCAIHLCLLSSDGCSPDCNSEHHWREHRSLDFHDSASISMGPLMLSEGNTDKLVPEDGNASEASSLCSSLMLLLVLLMSALALL